MLSAAGAVLVVAVSVGGWLAASDDPPPAPDSKQSVPARP